MLLFGQFMCDFIGERRLWKSHGPEILHFEFWFHAHCKTWDWLSFSIPSSPLVKGFSIWLLEKTQQDDVQSMLCSAKSRAGLFFFFHFLTVLYDHKSCVYARPEKEYFSELSIFPVPEKNLFSLLLSSRSMTFILKSASWVCPFLPISSAVLCIFSPRQPRWHMNLPSNGWVPLDFLAIHLALVLIFVHSLFKYNLNDGLGGLSRLIFI